MFTLETIPPVSSTNSSHCPPFHQSFCLAFKLDTMSPWNLYKRVFSRLWTMYICVLVFKSLWKDEILLRQYFFELPTCFKQWIDLVFLYVLQVLHTFENYFCALRKPSATRENCCPLHSRCVTLSLSMGINIVPKCVIWCWRHWCYQIRLRK